MFHIFENQDDRRKFGGSAFIELQYCRMELGTKINKIVSVNEIENWKNDSLYIYIDDIDEFIKQYGNAFKFGIHDDLSEGFIDIYGINYYSLEQIDNIMDIVINKEPIEYEILLAWLNEAKKSNGFYILGV